MILSNVVLYENIVKNKDDIKKVKTFCEEFNLEVSKKKGKKFSDYLEEEYFIDLINENVSYDILEYLIDLIGEDIKNYLMPLFRCVECKHFKLANLLIEKNVDINEKIDIEIIQYIHGEESYSEEEILFKEKDFDDYLKDKEYNDIYYHGLINIIEFLIRIKSLDKEKLTFILEKGSIKLITSTVLITFIYDKKFKFLDLILNYRNNLTNDIILNQFLINGYKNKNKLSSKQINEVIYKYGIEEITNIISKKGNYITKYKKNSKNEYPIVAAIKTENLDIFKLFLDYARRYKIMTRLCTNKVITNCIEKGQKNMLTLLIKYAEENGINIGNCISNQHSLITAIHHNNFKIFRLLMSYVEEHNKLTGTFLLLSAFEKSSIRIVKLLIHYAKNGIINFYMNENDSKGDFPLLMAAKNKKNSQFFQLVIEYANEHGELLKINKCDNKRYFPLRAAVENNNETIVKIIIDYANEHNILLDLNKKYNDEVNFASYLIYKAIENNNTNIFRLLLEYVHDHGILLNINFNIKKGKDKSLLQLASYNNNELIVLLLIIYAKEYGILLDVNLSEMYFKYPLLTAISNNSVNIVKLLMEYSEEKGILLDVNSRKEHIDSPLSYAVKNNNETIVRLLIQYAQKNNIYLNLQRPNWERSLKTAKIKKNETLIELLNKYDIEHKLDKNIFLQFLNYF
ncbi:ankyrin [Anaeromyces robustus]|uniref:Ankyrin n=1 Tax=Anaeromyces robustus TaxID=1754192 RepID=A0A1Y1X9N5_9FUNG|nr:ankyrin [Anaeromyces robustus]|eukprot:ORX82455.1 ankyrin [Anaeromyces robustus]